MAQAAEAMKKLVLLLALIISGCATVPPLDFMVKDVGIVDNRKDAELVVITVGFAEQKQQGKMETDHGFPPIWKEALVDAMARSLIFADRSDARVNLSVRITEVDAPSFGVSMTTEVGAIYEIIDRSNGDLLFAEKIDSEGVVPGGYAFTGIVRARESVNRAVRNNIADFIVKLELADLSKPIFEGGDSN